MGIPLLYVMWRPLSSVMVIDYSPVLAVRFWRGASFGAGPDIQRMYGEFDSVGTLGGELDTDATNKANDTGYGYHMGLLYEFTPLIRAGLSYHSQVVHHLSGSSKFVGPLADALNNNMPINTKRTTTNITLPPYTALSAYYGVSPCFSVMGSVIYTQWSVFRQLVLNDVAGIALPFDASTSIQVTIPAHYRNSWNFALGADLVLPKILPYAAVSVTMSHRLRILSEIFNYPIIIVTSLHWADIIK